MKKVIFIMAIIIALTAIMAVYFAANKDVTPFAEFRARKEKLLQRSGEAFEVKDLELKWNSQSSSFELVELGAGGMAEGNSLSSAAAYRDEDNIVETYQLEKGTLSIHEGNNLLWKSKSEWWVDSFALADVDGDGNNNLSVSVWKAGNFGPSKPFWITENDQSIKNHFFVFELNPLPRPKWQSSNLEKPNCAFAFADVDGDGKKELIVIEGEYEESAECQGEYVAVWKWNEWGFSNEWRSRSGNFVGLRAKDNQTVEVEEIK